MSSADGVIGANSGRRYPSHLGDRVGVELACLSSYIAHRPTPLMRVPVSSGEMSHVISVAPVAGGVAATSICGETSCDVEFAG